MPADIAKANSFNLTTDFPLDKVVYITQGSFNIPAFGFVDFPILHGLPFKPLPMGTWSTTPDFSTSYDFGSGPLGGNPFAINNSVYSNTNTITVSTTNNTGSAVTFYYRIYCFEPSDANLDAPYTNVLADTFSFNSDYNYAKLYINTIVNVTGTSTQNILHGLGYRPQVLAWQEYTGTGDLYPVNFTDTGIGTYFVAVDTSNVAVSSITAPAAKIHVRIYLDD